MGRIKEIFPKTPAFRSRTVFEITANIRTQSNTPLEKVKLFVNIGNLVPDKCSAMKKNLVNIYWTSLEK